MYISDKVNENTVNVYIVYIVINENEHKLICTKCTFYHGGKTLEKSNTVKTLLNQKNKKIQKKNPKKKMDFL
jgi:hypothetical protein